MNISGPFVLCMFEDKSPTTSIYTLIYLVFIDVAINCVTFYGSLWICAFAFSWIVGACTKESIDHIVFSESERIFLHQFECVCHI